MRKIFLNFCVVTNISLMLINISYSQNPPCWIQQNSGTNTTLNEIYFINKNTGWVVGGLESNGTNGVITKTTNGGNNWITQFTGNNNFQKVFFINQNTGFVAGGYIIPPFISNRIVLKTTNGGGNWVVLLNDSQSPLPLASIYFVDSLLGWIGSDENFGILKTTNGGQNFINMNISYSSYDIQFTDSTTGYFGGLTTLCKTTNRGNNWNLIYTDPTRNIRKLFFINSLKGYAVGHNTVLKTYNGGLNWTLLDGGDYLERLSIHFVDSSYGAIILYDNYPADWSALDLTTNAGINWTRQTGWPNALMSVFFVNKDTGWVCGKNGLILKTTTGGITSVNNIKSKLPDKFALFQNYPNPFNPVTKIKYDLKKEFRSQELEVKLSIFDILGRKIKDLVNERLQPGTYEVTFDGSNLPSGVYFYKLTAGNFTETMKMLMIK
jgi:photosystem II stability/assembly factor-like uncharacterized protein